MPIAMGIPVSSANSTVCRALRVVCSREALPKTVVIARNPIRDRQEKSHDVVMTRITVDDGGWFHA